MAPLLNRIKGSLRPIQRRVLFPVRNALRLRAWEATRTAPVIINFHGIEREIRDVRMQPYVLTADEFRTTLRIILERHEVVSLDRLVDTLDSGDPLPPQWAVLTFDDGYLDNLTIARPILKELGDLPATVFICPGLTGEDAWLPDSVLRLVVLHHPANVLRLRSVNVELEMGPRASRPQAYQLLIGKMRSIVPSDRLRAAEEAIAALPHNLRDELTRKFQSEKLVNSEQLKRLVAEPNIAIGAHTMHHMILHKDHPAQTIESQVAECRRVLAEQTGCEARHFAYPGGMTCPVAYEAVRAAGYRSGLTIVPGEVTRGSDRYLLPRLSASRYEVVTRRQLACAAMKGAQGWWF